MRGGERPGPFATQWGEYRRRRRRDTFAFAALLGLPAAAALVFVLRRGRFGDGPAASVLWWAFVAAWVGVGAYHGVASYREEHWPCPQCRRPYFVAAPSWRRRQPGARHCANCGLPKWAGKEEAQQAPVVPA